MMNPFQNSEECSFEDYSGSLPICFNDTTNFKQLIASQLQTKMSSPIEKIDLDSMSEKFSNQDVFETKEQIQKIKLMQNTFKQLKVYTESLEKRNLDLAMELQREKMKNHQLISAFSFIKNQDEVTSKIIEEKNGKIRDFEIKFNHLTTKEEETEKQMKNSQSQNKYLKELILIANENYEKLEEKYKQICFRNQIMQKEKDCREEEMMKKMGQIKEIFTKIVLDKNEPVVLKEKKRQENIINCQSVRSNGGKKEVEQAYRQVFLKTLKGKKQNQKT